MKVQLFRNEKGQVIAAAEVDPGRGVTATLVAAEAVERGAAAQAAAEVVEGDLSDPDAFFRQYSK